MIVSQHFHSRYIRRGLANPWHLSTGILRSVLQTGELQRDQQRHGKRRCKSSMSCILCSCLMEYVYTSSYPCPQCVFRAHSCIALLSLRWLVALHCPRSAMAATRRRHPRRRGGDAATAVAHMHRKLSYRWCFPRRPVPSPKRERVPQKCRGKCACTSEISMPLPARVARTSNIEYHASMMIRQSPPVTCTRVGLPIIIQSRHSPCPSLSSLPGTLR